MNKLKKLKIMEEIKIITSESELANTFNKHYINIAKKSSGTKPRYFPS